ncbi:MAG: peptide chain release factor N(5)-glutamine methyltransferase [Clostridia bacterium]|nr:peptide chain release factor N(5)-glutamine methyltransferase [Clostridia bacterium]
MQNAKCRMQKMKKMTYNEAVDILLAAGIGSASHDAEEIFCHFGGYYKSTFYLMNRIESDSPELIRAIERRANREPLQYILGIAYFYREKYKVTPDCLIPRFDTEILVDYAVNNLPEGAVFMDLCTGSGCVAISTLNNTVGTCAIAVDIDGGALALAEENARSIGVADRIHLRRADLMSEVVDEPVFAVLSNPPYVSESVYRELESEIFAEPRHAFVGGEDGGDFYRHLTPIYREFIADEGFIAYEIGYDQADMLRAIAEECNMTCEILKDYGARDRVAVLRKN